MKFWCNKCFTIDGINSASTESQWRQSSNEVVLIGFSGGKFELMSITRFSFIYDVIFCVISDLQD